MRQDPPSARNAEHRLDAAPLTVWQQLLPILLLMAAFLAVAGGLLLHSAQQQNRIAEGAGRHLVETAISVEADDIESFVADYAYWDATARNVVATYNAAWANDNVGQWAIDGLDMDGALVVGAGNRVIHAASRHDGADLRPAPPFDRELQRLIATARAKVGAPGEPPGAVTGFFRTPAGLHLGAAAAIVWEEARAEPPLDDGVHGVLLFYRTFDAALLDAMGRRFLLDGLGVRAAELPAGAAAVPLQSADGVTLGHLGWRVARPGTAMLRDLTVPLAVAAAAVLLILIVIVRRARRSAGVVRRYQARLEAQAADLRAARDSAEAASKAKTQFLALMSHELRTPLNAVIGFSDVLRQTAMAGMAWPRRIEYADYIHASGQYLLELINDILDMSKVEAGRYELVEERVGVDALVDECLRLVEGRARAKEIALESAPVPAELWVDRRALKQILTNLLTNAIKFSPRGSTVTIDARHRCDGLELRVRDRGRGMSQRELQHAFTPFGQVRDAHLSCDEGTGLGLTICRSLAALHGGSIVVDTAPGEGTTVHLRLPAARVLDAPEAAPDGPAAVSAASA